MPRRNIETLTETKVRRIKDPGLYSDGFGLNLRADANGNKRWLQRLTINGKRRNAGLGSYPAVSLAEARNLAHANLREVKEGKDPIEARRVKRANAGIPSHPTVEEVSRRVLEANRKGWTPKTYNDALRSLENHVFPAIGKRLVSAVTPRDVLGLLEDIWTTKPAVARRVKQRLEMVFSYAVVSGWCVTNPAAAGVKDVLPKGRYRPAHHPAMAYADLPAFLAFVRDPGGCTSQALTRLALEFLIVTAARTGEVRSMTWAEVDLEAATWTVPAGRMKARREHRVPLSTRAAAILQEARQLSSGSELVFPAANGRKPLHMNTLYKLMARLEGVEASVHGFRSTFRDWTLEQTATPWAVAEAALAHQLGDATQAAYARTDLFDKRRELMEAWGSYCSGQ